MATAQDVNVTRTFVETRTPDSGRRWLITEDAGVLYEAAPGAQLRLAIIPVSALERGIETWTEVPAGGNSA